MSTTNQHNVLNARENQNNQLLPVNQHEPTTTDENIATTEINLPTETPRRRRRPAIYASTEERREASNARRRVLRRSRQSIDAYTSASEVVTSTPFNQHPENNAAPVPNATSIAEIIPNPAEQSHRVPNATISTTNRHEATTSRETTPAAPRPSRPRGRPPIYTSAEQRRDAINARQREHRQRQQRINTYNEFQNHPSTTIPTSNLDASTSANQGSENTSSPVASETYMAEASNILHPPIIEGLTCVTPDNIEITRFTDLPLNVVKGFRSIIPAVPKGMDVQTEWNFVFDMISRCAQKKRKTDDTKPRQ